MVFLITATTGTGIAGGPDGAAAAAPPPRNEVDEDRCRHADDGRAADPDFPGRMDFPDFYSAGVWLGTGAWDASDGLWV